MGQWMLEYVAPVLADPAQAWVKHRPGKSSKVAPATEQLAESDNGKAFEGKVMFTVAAGGPPLILDPIRDNYGAATAALGGSHTRVGPSMVDEIDPLDLGARS